MELSLDQNWVLNVDYNFTFPKLADNKSIAYKKISVVMLLPIRISRPVNFRNLHQNKN